VFRWLLIVLLLVGGLNWLLHDRAVDPGPGAVAPALPIQKALVDAAPIIFGEFSLKPLARFALDARVLSREDYSWDSGARLSPMDLALGWGPMSDSAVLEQIKIAQGGRKYRWRVGQFPVPRRAIETHSANMHLIPADSTVEREMKRARVGHVVSLQGYLVEATEANGWRWRSSTTRDDVGNGACELILVERIEFR